MRLVLTVSAIAIAVVASISGTAPIQIADEHMVERVQHQICTDKDHAEAPCHMQTVTVDPRIDTSQQLGTHGDDLVPPKIVDYLQLEIVDIDPRIDARPMIAIDKDKVPRSDVEERYLATQDKDPKGQIPMIATHGTDPVVQRTCAAIPPGELPGHDMNQRTQLWTSKPKTSPLNLTHGTKPKSTIEVELCGKNHGQNPKLQLTNIDLRIDAGQVIAGLGVAHMRENKTTLEITHQVMEKTGILNGHMRDTETLG